MGLLGLLLLLISVYGKPYATLIKNPKLVSIHQLHLNYNGYIKFIVNKEYWNYNKKSILCERDDLIQVGHMSLQRALEKYDDSYNNQFSTYAIGQIKWGLFNYVKKHTKNSKKSMEFVENYHGVSSTPDKLGDIIESDARLNDDSLGSIMLKKYYGLEGDSPKTYDQLAKEFNRSRVAINRRVLRQVLLIQQLIGEDLLD